MSLLSKYTVTLEAQLGAILANTLIKSKESSRVIRDLSKQLDSMSIELRRELMTLDKTLTIKDVK